MSLVSPNPAQTAPARSGLARPSPLWRLLASTDHKTIGITYLGVGALFFLIGGIEALVMRAQLATPNNTLLLPQTSTRSSPCTAPP